MCFLKNSTLWGMYSIDMMVILSTYIKKNYCKGHLRYPLKLFFT